MLFKSVKLARAFPAQNVRLMSYISNKKITRIESDLRVTREEVEDGAVSANDTKIPIELVNRNPRNLEQLSLEPKKIGFELDIPSRAFLNKLIFERSSNHLLAKIVHHSGRVLVTASTKEPGLSETLRRDKKSAEILAKIFARRALESGFNCVHVELTAEEKNSDKMTVFLKSVQDNGLAIKEPEFIWPRLLRDA